MKKFRLLALTAVMITTLASCDKPHHSSGTIDSSDNNGSSVVPPPPSNSSGGETCINDGTLLDQIDSMKANDDYSGKVVIAGIRGNDLFVEDQSGGGFVYLNTNISFGSFDIGDRLEISGKIAEFAAAGIKQISPTKMSKIGSCGLKKPVQIEHYTELDNHRFSSVSVKDLMINNLTIVAGSASDSRLNVSLGSDAFDIFISKRLANKSAIDSFFDDVQAGAKLSVEGGFADYYKKAQIAITDLNQLALGDLSRADQLKAIENSISSITSLKSVKRNVTLPTSGPYGSTIKWSSSNPSVLSENGVVTRSTEDIEVTLSYTITLDGKAEATKSFKILVAKIVDGENDYEYTYVEPSYSGDYYVGIDENLRERSLLLELDGLLDRTHKNFTTYKNLFDVFKYTDADPNNPNQIISFYSGKSSTRGNMNREHVWPNSRGGSAVENDPHMTRPTITAENSARGNDFFNEGKKWDPNSFGNDKYRGIAARIIFYCAVIAQESGLKLVDLDNDSTGNKSMGKLSKLLEWNLKYDIDASEIQRNDILFEKYKTNRNPFIDDRNYACKIWGQTNSTTKQVCGYKA